MSKAYSNKALPAGTVLRERAMVLRMRTLAFTILTPFYFIRAGTYVSARAMVAGAGLIGLLLLIKLGTKFIGVWLTVS